MSEEGKDYHAPVSDPAGRVFFVRGEDAKHGRTEFPEHEGIISEGPWTIAQARMRRRDLRMEGAHVMIYAADGTEIAG